MSVPPDLRVLCRRLAAASSEDLPALCPSLISNVLQCRDILSAPQETKSKDKSSAEASRLVNILKTQIKTLLHGRSPAGRFGAVVLVKAVIDVGGWECLRTSQPWVQGLLSVLQKSDPAPSKELCIVTLARIYASLHPHQTLVRELATPTLPSFATSCLQLLKPLAAGNYLTVRVTLIEVIANAFLMLLPLYPTTMRPSAAQIRSTFSPFLAPTSPDSVLIPNSLRQASRRLIITLHHTSPKNGGAEEWVKTMDSFIRTCHLTADQTFRAVRESWESTTGYIQATVKVDDSLQGGGTSDDLPPWAGLGPGIERLVGLLETLTEWFRCPTRQPVASPLDSIMDLANRLTLVNPPTSTSKDGEDSLQLNLGVEREERYELWSMIPGIHVAVLRLLHALLERFARNMLPFSIDILDMAVRIFTVVKPISTARKEAYLSMRELLILTGPSLPKTATDSLGPLIQCCCQDLLGSAGHTDDTTNQSAANMNGNKLGSYATNADALLLPEQSSVRHSSTSWPPKQPSAAQQLLPFLFSHLPQNQLSRAHRAMLDRTAILTQNKDAMLASCLNPYKDNGLMYPSIIPFLSRQYPEDQELEVLRSNLLPASGTAGTVLGTPADSARPVGGSADQAQAAWLEDDLPDAPPSSKPEMSGKGLFFGVPLHPVLEPTAQPDEGSSVPQSTPALGAEEAPAHSVDEANQLKRKGEEIEPSPPKRLDKGKAAESVSPWEVTAAPAPSRREEAVEDGEEDSDDESVHIDMTIDYDDDDDEDSDAEENEE